MRDFFSKNTRGILRPARFFCFVGVLAESAKILRFAAQICIKMYAYFFFRFNSARCMVLQKSKLQENINFFAVPVLRAENFCNLLKMAALKCAIIYAGRLSETNERR